MQISNSSTPSFKGFISPGIGKNTPLHRTDASQDKLIKRAVDYYLGGDKEVVLNDSDSKTFSEILNNALGNVFFKNNVTKKIEQIDEDVYIYYDSKATFKPIEGCVFVTKA